MSKKGFINAFFQNCSKPEGFFGRLLLRGMNHGHAPLSQWAMSKLNWQPDWQVLDIGCCGGANLAAMLQLCPNGKVYGLDISPDSVAFSKALNQKQLGSRCFVELGSAEQLPYPARHFDVVTAFETIYFWRPLSQSFAEAARVLKPQGRFLICCEASDPNDDTWTKRIDGMVIHSVSELQACLSQAGFDKITVFNREKGGGLCIISQKN